MPFAVPRDRTFDVSLWHIFALVCALAPATARGHGDLHEAITELDREIAARPGEAALYLRRGELHRKHEDWLKAVADYDRAEVLDPSLAVVDLARGVLGIDAHRTEAARAALDRFIGNRPDDPVGYATRARLLRSLKDAPGAAGDFVRAVALSRQPAPELFVETAEALREAGRPDEAVAILDDGIGRLGPLVTLAAMALDLEAALGRTEAELQRVDALIAATSRKEGWLFRRGNILEKTGRLTEARAAYELAREALAVVPEHRRETAAMRGLQQNIEAALGRFGR